MREYIESNNRLGNKLCTGCMLCKNICDKEAIYIVEGDLGFLYPKIDGKLCLDCGKCISFCPYMTSDEKKESIEACYAIQASDEIRRFSSSGGAFYVIAEYFIHYGGYVVGAAFEKGSVVHTIVSEISDIKRLCTSKYVQSSIELVYTPVKRLLEHGEKVLFSGTPCQCEAIQRYCGKNENLFLLDILCMGVPSQKLFSKYIDETFVNDISSVNFRYKIGDLWNYDFGLAFSSEFETTVIPSNTSSYFWLFNNGISLRESCVECKYACLSRVGDISLGDFWNIRSFDSCLDDERGTSLVLSNTKKGSKLLDECKKNFKLMVEVPKEKALERNKAIREPLGNSYLREKYKRLYKERTVEEAKNELMHERAKCGILNYWACDDNGAILTAFALQKSLLSIGYDSLLIDIGMARKANGISRHFEARYLRTTLPVDKDEVYGLNNRFETFIVGSDQVFRREWVPDEFFLGFVNNNKRKIAVSASFGNDRISCSKTEKMKMSYWLRRFDSISTREISGIKLLKLLGVNGTRIIDPVFWLTVDKYIELFDLKKSSIKKVTYYYRDKSESTLKALHIISDKLGAIPIVLDDNTEVELFLQEIYTSELLLTDSYHGVCYALLFNVDFLCTRNETRGNDRFSSLMNVLGISEEHFVSQDAILNRSVYPLRQNTWDEINKNIQKERKIALAWMNRSLKKRKGIYPQARALLYLKRQTIIEKVIKRLYIVSLVMMRKKLGLVCYGAGNYGVKATKKYGERIDFFIDKDTRKRMIEGICVLSYEEAKPFLKTDTPIVITVSDNYISEIETKLKNDGYTNINRIENY